MPQDRCVCLVPLFESDTYLSRGNHQSSRALRQQRNEQAFKYLIQSKPMVAVVAPKCPFIRYVVLIKLRVRDQLKFHEVSETKPETGMPQWLEISIDVPSVYRPGISFYSNIHSLLGRRPSNTANILHQFKRQRFHQRLRFLPFCSQQCPTSNLPNA